MSEPSMVCNGLKENIERCAVNDLYSAFEKSNTELSNTTENKTLHKPNSMTIGTIPFPDFDHLYASNVEENGETNMMNINIARSNLNAYHLNIIEEQARIIDSQNQEIVKLRKQNASLVARIERMSRRLNLNQCGRKNSRRNKYSYRNSVDDDLSLEVNENFSNFFSDNKMKQEVEDSFPDDVPLIQLTPDIKVKSDSDNKNQDTDGAREKIHDEIKDKITNPIRSENQSTRSRSNFRIKFRRNEVPFRKRRSKIVKFEEEKSIPPEKLQRRNCAQTVHSKLVTDNAVLFLNTTDSQPACNPVENNINLEEAQSATNKKKKSLKIPILTTTEPYFVMNRDVPCPTTYKPASLEVPSFRVIEKNNPESLEVPANFHEDTSLEAVQQRHLRFEIIERKRKKWDVQRIRELRQNERLKEKLRKRKSRFNKLESPKQSKTSEPEQISTLFPDIKNIEKIIITDFIPVNALGSSIPKVPSWNTEFRTEWMNDGSVPPEIFEDHIIPTHHHSHHRDSKIKPS